MASALIHFPPMGVYETLFKFLDATGKYMGTEGTHPWAQGFPLTTQVPGGPEIPTTINFSHADLKYPPATGGMELLEAIRDYYNHFYGSEITTDNVAIFAGGRPGIYATLAFLQPAYRVLIEETEYTPYWDALKLLGRDHTIIPSNPSNNFRPTISDYKALPNTPTPQYPNTFVVKSNPCNPTGVTWQGDQLKALVDFCREEGRGGLFDEAYEFFQSAGGAGILPAGRLEAAVVPERGQDARATGRHDSAMRYVGDIDLTNIFVVSAATKGLQAPGLRVGWVVASRENIELFRNFSSIAMGGVARPSQICTAELLGIERVTQAREAIGKFYGSQRERYGEALRELGFELFTGDGGFYHWGRLPGGLTADEFNERLFKHEAAILPGTLCDMFRRGPASPMANFVRFSFGPLRAESFEGDIAILRAALG